MFRNTPCATYDRRLLVGETKESVLQPIIEKMEELKKKDPQFSYKVSYAVGKEECYTGEKIQGERFFPGWLFGEEEEWVAKIKSELEKEGFSPKITTYNFCTNGSHYAGEAAYVLLEWDMQEKIWHISLMSMRRWKI